MTKLDKLVITLCAAMLLGALVGCSSEEGTTETGQIPVGGSGSTGALIEGPTAGQADTPVVVVPAVPAVTTP